MAINLKKEESPEENENIRVVYPENDSPEIYPQKEIYPAAGADVKPAVGFAEPRPEDNVRRLGTAPVNSPPAVNRPEDFQVRGQGEAGTIFSAGRKGKRKKSVFGRIVGLVFGIAMLSFVFTAVSEGSGANEPYTETAYDFSAADIAALGIADDISTIRVEPSLDGDFHVTVQENSKKTYSVENRNGTLSINGEREKSTFNFIGISFTPPEVTVKVPENYEGRLNIETNNSSVKCSAGKDISVKSVNGSVELSDITDGNITVKNTNGKIQVDDSDAARLDLKNANGSIKLSHTTVSGSTEITGENGSIELSRVTLGDNAVVSNDNGSVKAANTDLGSNADISTENGSIKMNGVSFEDLRISSDNGSINVDADVSESSYTINSHSKNGSSNLENGGNGEYTLDVSTKNGSIDFDFNK